MTTRRDFLMTTSAAAAWLALPGCARVVGRDTINRVSCKPW
jgi:hypothetical protein